MSLGNGAGARDYEAGVAYELRIPSGAQTGIKINGLELVIDGSGAETAGIVFDAGLSIQNIHTTGRGVQMSPVLRVRGAAAGNRVGAGHRLTHPLVRRFGAAALIAAAPFFLPRHRPTAVRGVSSAPDSVTLPPADPDRGNHPARHRAQTPRMSSNQTGSASTLIPLARVDELCDFIAENERGKHGARLCDFARIFFGKLPRQLLHERSMENLRAMTVAAFEFLKESRPEDVNVQVINPEDEGWDAPATIIRAEVGDRPFIVDSIREYLSGENLTIHHYMYPVLCVERSADGRLLDLGGDARGVSEALVHCEISRIEDPERRAELAAGVQRRLSDVVLVTDDFGKMLKAVDDTIAMADHYSEEFPPEGGGIPGNQ